MAFRYPAKGVHIRSRITGEVISVKFHLQLHPTIFDKLREIAVSKGVSVSEATIKLIIKGLNHAASEKKARSIPNEEQDNRRG